MIPRKIGEGEERHRGHVRQNAQRPRHAPSRQRGQRDGEPRASAPIGSRGQSSVPTRGRDEGRFEAQAQEEEGQEAEERRGRRLGILRGIVQRRRKQNGVGTRRAIFQKTRRSFFEDVLRRRRLTSSSEEEPRRRRSRSKASREGNERHFRQRAQKSRQGLLIAIANRITDWDLGRGLLIGIANSITDWKLHIQKLDFHSVQSAPFFCLPHFKAPYIFIRKRHPKNKTNIHSAFILPLFCLHSAFILCGISMQ